MAPKKVCGSQTAAAFSKNVVWLQNGCFLSLPGIKKLFGCRTATVDKWLQVESDGKIAVWSENGGRFKKKTFWLRNGSFLCRRPPAPS